MNTEKYQVKQVLNPHGIHACVPGSKSMTNRALLLAAMSGGETILSNVLFSDDSRVFMQALKDLDFAVEISEADRQVKITGCGGKIPKKEGEIYVGSAGTAARFLTAFLGLSGGTYRLDASEQMKKRPMESLIKALEELGCRFSFEGEPYHFPFTLTGATFEKQEVSVSIEKSSQFLSALLICAPLFPVPFRIDILGNHGMDYVAMTLQMMQQFGGPAFCLTDHSVLLDQETSYGISEYRIEPDISAACYFYAAGAILKEPVKVDGVKNDSLQGDLKFLSVLEEMGCTLRENEDGIELLPPETGLKGGKFDLSSFSDQTLTLAAIAPFAIRPVTITGIGHIRLQESDRIHAIVCNLKTLGIRAEEKDGEITVYPGKPAGGEIETFDDHRVAMSFALPGLKTPGVIIKDPMCCRKTFEDYFDCLEKYVY